MCGVFGIYGHPEAAALTQLGLYALQHRGQESAGIVAVDAQGVARVSRAMGLVSEGFDDGAMRTLAGPIAIGHRPVHLIQRSACDLFASCIFKIATAWVKNLYT